MQLEDSHRPGAAPSQQSLEQARQLVGSSARWGAVLRLLISKDLPLGALELELPCARPQHEVVDVNVHARIWEAAEEFELHEIDAHPRAKAELEHVVALDTFERGEDPEALCLLCKLRGELSRDFHPLDRTGHEHIDIRRHGGRARNHVAKKAAHEPAAQLVAGVVSEREHEVKRARAQHAGVQPTIAVERHEKFCGVEQRQLNMVPLLCAQGMARGREYRPHCRAEARRRRPERRAMRSPVRRLRKDGKP